MDGGRLVTCRESAAVPRCAIDIAVRDGVITLDGQVGSLSHKRLAGVLAWWVPGSRDVVNVSYGRWVPWVDASIAPGGTDLRIGRVSNETRLTGPFMNLIQAGVGVSYFTTEHTALYVGLQAQHISNAGFNGTNRNFSLNTAESVAAGFSWFIPWQGVEDQRHGRAVPAHL